MEERLFIFTSTHGDYIGTIMIRAYDLEEAEEKFRKEFPMQVKWFNYVTSILISSKERLVKMASISYGEV